MHAPDPATVEPEPPQADVAAAGHVDPPGEAPWAMQLVVHVDRAAPPSRTAVCAAAARAVVALLHDPRAAGGWEPAITRWTDGRIRKHVRRATRPAAWERASVLPGVTVEHDGARVRALVPCATDDVPRDVARLQLTGTELPDPDPVPHADPVPDGSLVVSLAPVPLMPAGKAAAAVGHAAQLAASAMPDARRVRWAADGFPVVVEQPPAGRWTELTATAPVRVVDAGLTVVAPGTTTAVARWA
ncbi:protein of unknown function UPF0099 [Cellulomonas flavigena DSM 20109]|uniref:Uncharacterized protein n=1 Tax=Cellulomonas flavigena (strain ATCC 482 / DSM 20109 / BCRC 11376 / JCM 18109 / NBRC 3775 / NCIMB 8073 / NRS 134) TaxID=446466 RepID=D5UK98_CELFN|nr:hypothetical protein [Cellulomonas flavigena]ADG75759.1 protein of unknown function UPF0099 [Cellulomonas flavigena DSM 20109]